MNEPEEIFDVVDERDQVIAQAPRGAVHRRGWRHRAVHVLLFNDLAELFVQTRAAGKDTFPLCYDSSASGHLNSGEDYDAAAVREVHEELGLQIPPAALTRCLRIDAGPQTGQEFVWVYRVQGNWQPIINPAELADGSFWPAARVTQLVTDNPGQCAPSFCLVVHELHRRHLWPAARA